MIGRRQDWAVTIRWAVSLEYFRERVAWVEQQLRANEERYSNMLRHVLREVGVEVVEDLERTHAKRCYTIQVSTRVDTSKLGEFIAAIIRGDAR